MKIDLFQPCGHCWVFQICWHIECSTFTESSFRIWNSSTGIPSPPLALFIVMLHKAHLTSNSRMSGSRWVITPSWLSGLWRSFLLAQLVNFRKNKEQETFVFFKYCFGTLAVPVLAVIELVVLVLKKLPANARGIWIYNS